jgi:hypothetical protein
MPLPPPRWHDGGVADDFPDQVVPAPPELLRAADFDRKQVAERLRLAHGEGLITLAEFDQRVGLAWQARTRAELARLVFDLPEPRPETPPAPRAAVGPVRYRLPTALRVLVIIWLCVSVLNVVIWGLASVTAAEILYPWWVWVAGPSGAVLGTLAWALGSTTAEPPRRPRHDSASD